MRIASRIVPLSLVLATVLAGAAEPRLPAPVAAWVKAAADMCREVEGKPDVTNAIQRGDFNGDGAEDYLVSVEGINCDGAASIYGDRQKALAVFVGDGKGGATEAFSDSTFGSRIEGTGAKAKLWLAVMGVQCGRKPARDFASETFCERPLVWNAATRKFDYAPVSSAKIMN